MSTDPVPSSIESVVQRRRELESQICRLAELAKQDLSEAASNGDTADADFDLKALYEDLADLFALKELGGYFDDIVEPAFHMQHSVEQLKADHRALLADLIAMRNELSNRPSHVRRLLRGWLTRFQNLERREARLLQDVWNVDLGSID